MPFTLPPEYSTRSAWHTAPEDPPPDVWAKIALFHRAPLASLALAFELPLVPSARSVYRSPAWEYSKGRSGLSLHTFPEGSKGAMDITRSDGGNIAEIIPTLLFHGPWRRICYYPGLNPGNDSGPWPGRFVHLDYGDGPGSTLARRAFYTAPSPQSPWQFLYFLPEPPAPPY